MQKKSTVSHVSIEVLINDLLRPYFNITRGTQRAGIVGKGKNTEVKGVFYFDERTRLFIDTKLILNIFACLSFDDEKSLRFKGVLILKIFLLVLRKKFAVQCIYANFIDYFIRILNGRHVPMSDFNVLDIQGVFLILLGITFVIS